jgi:hypothetical protein
MPTSEVAKGAVRAARALVRWLGVVSIAACAAGAPDQGASSDSVADGASVGRWLGHADDARPTLESTADGTGGQQNSGGDPSAGDAAAPVSDAASAGDRSDAASAGDRSDAALALDLGFVEVRGEQLTVDGQPFKLKGVNYYPYAYNWDQMWGCRAADETCDDPWRPDVIAEDFARARSLGINTVRIILQWSKFSQPQLSGLAAAEPAPEMLKRLDQVIELAHRHDMRVMLSLFDWVHLEDISLDLAVHHVKTLARRYRDDPRLAIWDVQNETDHRFWRVGCSGSRAECIDHAFRQLLHERLRAIIAALKAIDPNHPVTVGLYGTFVATGGDRGARAAGTLDRFTIDSVNLLDAVDVVCLHWYNEAGEHTERVLAEALVTLQGVTDKPIVLQEIGRPHEGLDDEGRPVAGELDPSSNERFYRSWIRAVEQADIAGAMPWVLLDFDPLTSYFEAGSRYQQLFFGLFDYLEDEQRFEVRRTGALFRDELDWQENACRGMSKIELPRTGLGSPEARQLARLYCATLGRPPDAAGFRYWAEHVQQGMHLEAVATRLLGSPEYGQRHRSLSDADFLMLHYIRAFGRAPDRPGLQFWLGKLADGTTRASVVSSFAESQELVERLAGQIAIASSTALAQPG